MQLYTHSYTYILHLRLLLLYLLFNIAICNWKIVQLKMPTEIESPSWKCWTIFKTNMQSQFKYMYACMYKITHSYQLQLPMHLIRVTGPAITGLIYTKYTCSYYGAYLLLCMCYIKSVWFTGFLMHFYLYGDN